MPPRRTERGRRPPTRPAKPKPPVRAVHPPVDPAEVDADFAAFLVLLEARGQQFSPEALDMIRRYGDQVVSRAGLLNLISPGDRVRLFTRHIAECLTPELVRVAGEAGSLVDIGSGAGLPGLPLAIVSPGLKVLLVEPRVRRAQFLEAASLSLGLGDRVEVFQGSAERLMDASKGTLGAGLATARAVDRLENVWPWALNFLRPGGHLAVFRSPGDVESELSGLKPPLPSASRTTPMPGQPRQLLFLTRP